MRDRTLCLAASIRRINGAGARIAIATENRPEIIELMFAIWAAECVVVPINYKLHAREMAAILDDAGASVVFASRKIGAELASGTGVPVEGHVAVAPQPDGDDGCGVASFLRH